MLTLLILLLAGSGLALLFVGAPVLRLVGGVLVALAVLGATRLGTPRPAPPTPAEPAAAPTPTEAAPTNTPSIPKPILDAEGVELAADIEAGRIGPDHPRLASWSERNPGAVAAVLVGWAELRSGAYGRALARSEPVTRGNEPDVVRATASAIAGESAYALGDFDRAVSHFEAALAVRSDPALSARLEAARRDANADRSFLTLASTHFLLKVSGGDETLAARFATLLDRAWSDADRLLGVGPGEQPIAYLYAPGELERTTASPPWVTGLYDGRVRLGQTSGDDREVEPLVRHEVAHVFVTHKSRNRAPAWLQEGIAQVFGGQAPPGQTTPPDGWLTARSFDLGDYAGAEAAYAASHDLTARLVEEAGWESIAQYVDRLGRGEATDEAFAAIYGRPLEDFEAR